MTEEIKMKYEEIKDSGKMLFSYDKNRQGSLTGVYGGTVEWWAVGNDIYRHETNSNSISFTGRSVHTEFVGIAKDVARLEKDLNAETMEMFGEVMPTNRDYYTEIYSDVMLGNY